MMGYVFLFAALMAAITKGYCSKKTSGYVNEYKDAMLFNSIRMVICFVIGLGVLAVSGKMGFLKINRTVLLITLLSGAANSAFAVLWLVSLKKGAYMMLDVFCMLGVLIPITGCAVFFGEAIEINAVIGMAVLIASVCLVCSYNNTIKQKITLSSFIVLLICGISNGLSDFSQKLFVKLTSDIPISVFNFYTYLFSAIILIICFLVLRPHSDNKETFNIKPIIKYVLIMSVCLFLYSYLKTCAAKYLPSAQLYPLLQGGGLILASVMSAVVFHERLTAKAIIGIILSFAALIIINVL